MFEKLIIYSVKNKYLVVLFTLLLVAIGVFAFFKLPIDAIPDITETQVVINTPNNNLTPDEIDKYITFPLESGLGGLSKVKNVRSISKFGLSQITIVFEDGTDIYWARQIVSERLQALKSGLPENTNPELGPITSGLGEIYMYIVKAKVPAPEGSPERLLQLMNLKSLQDWFIKPRLLTIEGVAEVNSQGGYNKKIFIEPYLDIMLAKGIHIEEISHALNENNYNTGGSSVEQTATQFLVQAHGRIESIEEIGNIFLKKLPNNDVLTIKDIAKVAYAKEIRTGTALCNGEETILGTVMMLLNGNSRTVSIDVHQKIQEIAKTLPEWASIEPVYNRSLLVNKTLLTIEENIIFGAGLVIIFLLLLIGNIRVAFITAIVIPISLALTFIVMKVFNVSGNLMSLGALDFGIIVDGAVIVMDNCVRQLQNRQKSSESNLTYSQIQETIINATIEIRSAAVFGQVIIILVFLPLFFLSGVQGKMFIPMASTFCAALVIGFVLSFTLVPALASIVLSKKISDKPSWLMNKIQNIYTPLQAISLRYKTLTLIICGIIACLAFLIAMRTGSNFLPNLDEGAISLQFIRSPQISLEQSIKLQELTEKSLTKFEEIDVIFSRIGTAEIATDPMGVNIADTYVILKGNDKWPKTNNKMRTKEELIELILKEVGENVSGQSVLVSQPIQLRFNELMEGVRGDISLKIFGESTEILLDLANEATEILKQIPGAGDIEAESKGAQSIFQILPNNKLLLELGMNKAELLNAVEFAMGGEEAGAIYEGNIKIPIVLRLNESNRSDLESLKKIPIGISENYSVPLSNLANFQFSNTIPIYRSENGKKRAAVIVNTRDRSTSEFVDIAKENLAKKLKLPEGYYLEWGGNFKNLQTAKNQLMLIIPFTLLAILLIIYLAFKSTMLMILVFFTIPFSAIGGILGLEILNLDFSLSAGVGFIALSGIAVLNGIVLVSYFINLKEKGHSGEDLIKLGTSIRLRPVMMTALTDIFGFIPMALSSGAGAEVQKPLAVVIIGGIASSTLLTLFLLPIMFSVVEKYLKFNSDNKKTLISH